MAKVVMHRAASKFVETLKFLCDSWYLPIRIKIDPNEIFIVVIYYITSRKKGLKTCFCNKYKSLHT